MRSSIIFEEDQTSIQTQKIQNQELESFQLLDCDTLVKAEIEAPNIMSFDYLEYLRSFFPMITLLCSGINHTKVSLLTRLPPIQQFMLTAQQHMFVAEKFMNIKDFLGFLAVAKRCP